jgi:hypothetical protein
VNDLEGPVPHEPHVPGRPSWDCLACGKAWPCDPAREHLAATHTPTQLAMLMWAQLEGAAFDLPGTPVGEMFDRFVKWTWRPGAL